MASSLASRGQDTIQPRYQSVFGDSCATWYIYCREGSDEIGTDIRKYTHNDTIKIEETTYNILRRTGSISMFSHYGNIPQYMRESRDHSKLYFKGQGYPEDDFPEVLIMDLDMNIGDTMDTQGWLEYSYYPNEYNSPTIIIDTVYYNEGRKILRTNYKKYNYYRGWDTLCFIEGIGPSWGPFYAGIEDMTTLICYYRDGEPQYHGVIYQRDIGYDLTGNHCIKVEYFGGISMHDEYSTATIYPNPTKDIFSILLKTPSTYNVTVVSATGRVVQRDEFHGCNITIDIQFQPRGVYFATISNKNGNKQTVKVIKL